MRGSRSRPTRRATLFENPHHPYTAALLAALPERATHRRLPAIPGVVPGQFDRPKGCLFAPRCEFAFAACRARAAAARLGGAGLRPLPRAARQRRRRRMSLLEARRLSREYPVSRGLVAQPRDGEGAEGRVVHAGARPHAGGGRRIRLGQVDAGAAADVDRKPDRGRAGHRGRGCRARLARAPAQAAPRGADRVPEPLWLAQSAPEDRPRLEEPLLVNTDLDGARRREAALRDDGRGRAAGPSSTTAIRICFPAASASASPSPAR